jgi:hypothetical protein
MTRVDRNRARRRVVTEIIFSKDNKVPLFSTGDLLLVMSSIISTIQGENFVKTIYIYFMFYFVTFLVYTILSSLR